MIPQPYPPIGGGGSDDDDEEDPKQPRLSPILPKKRPRPFEIPEVVVLSDDENEDEDEAPMPGTLRTQKRRRVRPAVEEDNYRDLEELQEMGGARDRSSDVEISEETIVMNDLFSEDYNEQAAENLNLWDGRVGTVQLNFSEGTYEINTPTGIPTRNYFHDVNRRTVHLQRHPTYRPTVLAWGRHDVFAERNDPGARRAELDVYTELAYEYEKTIGQNAAFSLVTPFVDMRQELTRRREDAQYDRNRNLDDSEFPTIDFPRIEYNETSGERLAVYNSPMAAVTDQLYQPLVGIPDYIVQEVNRLMPPERQLSQETIALLQRDPAEVLDAPVLYAYAQSTAYRDFVVQDNGDRGNVGVSEYRFVVHLIELYGNFDDVIYENSKVVEEYLAYLRATLVVITGSDYTSTLDAVLRNNQMTDGSPLSSSKQRAGIIVSYALWDAPASVGAHTYVYAVLAAIGIGASRALTFLLEIHPYPVTLGKNLFLHFAIKFGNMESVAILLTNMDVVVYEAKFGYPSFPAGTTSNDIGLVGMQPRLQNYATNKLRLIYALLYPFSTFTGDDFNETSRLHTGTPRENGQTRLEVFTLTPSPWLQMRSHYKLL